MNKVIRLKFKLFRTLIAVALALACLGLAQLAPNAFGVLPPPDGGYPGGNTAEGQNALLNLTSGSFNTANGWLSLRGDTTGSFNTAVGAGTLVLNTGDQNTAVGLGALLFNSATGNTATGSLAMFNNTTGDHNTAIGIRALGANTTGGANTAVGEDALLSNTTGSANIAVGSEAGNFVSTASNVICIGTGGDNVSNSCYIGNIFNQPSVNGVPVIVNNGDKLGVASSSKRFKEDIKPMDKASDALFSLNPVSFRYKKEIDPAGTSQFGLVAEEVARVNQDLVVRDREGKPYTVRYDQVNAMLLNEFLKEHKAFVTEQRKVEEQGAMIVQQQKQIEALTAGLQKVSARLELTGNPPQTVSNP